MNDSDRWEDYTMRVIASGGAMLHLASNTGSHTACGLSPWAFDVRAALTDWHVCKRCLKVIEAAKRRSQ